MLSAKYKAWGFEIWNEPDVPRGFAVPEYFGSWVKLNEFYLAGRAYGAFCSEVYGQIHATGANVIAGALVGSESSLEFAQGMVDGGLRCDYVSFHKYLRMGDDFDAGYNFSAELQNIVKKPLIWNETNIMGDGSPEHRKRQAEYLTYLRNSYTWVGIAALLVYSLHNWQWEYASLIADGQLTPAYEVWSAD